MRKKILFFLALFSMFLIVFKAMPDGSTGEAPIYSQQVMGSNDIGSTSSGSTGSVSESYPMGQVSLVYSGDSWGIAGYGAIMRGTKNGIPRYDESDDFYLGGTELIFVGAGSVANTNEYRTKHESFKKVIRILPSSPTNPDTWVVNNPDGSKEYYKKKMNNAGYEFTRGWLVTEIVGRGGYDSTKFEYQDMYETIGGVTKCTGEVLLKRIASGKAGQPADKMTFIDYRKGAISLNSKVNYRYGMKVETKSIPVYVYTFNGTSSVTYPWLKTYNNQPYGYVYDNGTGSKNYNLTGMFAINWYFGSSGEWLVTKVTPYGSNASVASITRDTTDKDNLMTSVGTPSGAKLNATNYDYYGYNLQFSIAFDSYDFVGHSLEDPGCLLSRTTTLTDVDGDGLLDIVKKSQGSTLIKVWYNRYNVNNDGKMAFEFKSFNSPEPGDLFDLNGNGGLYDFDGDGVVDRILVLSSGTELRVYRGTLGGANYITLESTAGIVISNWQYFQSSITQGIGITPLDMDGDAEPDQVTYDQPNSRLKVRHKRNNYSTEIIYPNYNNGFIRGYTTPNGLQKDTFRDLDDINGDGMPDVIIKNSGSNVVQAYYNEGYKFSTSLSGMISNNTALDTANLTAVNDTGGDMNYAKTTCDLIDINGDGLADRVEKDTSTVNLLKVWLNTGRSFNYLGTMSAPSSDTRVLIDKIGPASDRKTTAFYVDLNGDGLPDRIVKDASGNLNIAYNVLAKDGGYPGKLKSVYGPNGGYVRYTYRAINKLENKSCKPNMWVIKDKTVWDGSKENNGNNTATLTTSYTFKNGVYVYVQKTGPSSGQKVREYRGFAETTETAPTLDYVWTHYLTDEYSAGLKDIEEIHNSASTNNLFSESDYYYEWKTLDPYDKVKYCFPTGIFTAIRDGATSTPKYTNVEYSNDLGSGSGYGLNEFIWTQTATNYGEVDNGWTDLGFDKTETISTLNNDSALWIIGYPDEKIIKGFTSFTPSSWDVQSRAKMYYYTNGEAQVPSGIAVYGYLLKQTKTWDGTDYVNPTSFTYDAYGNILTVTDPLGYVTTTTYHPIFKSYPLTVSKVDNYSGSPITFTTDNVYDKFMRVYKVINREMKVGTSSDVYVASLFDEFGRVIKAWGPLKNGDATSDNNIREKKIYFEASLNADNTGKIDMPANTFVQKVMNLYPYGGPTPTTPTWPQWMAWTKASIDGFGRTIMVKSNGVDNSNYKEVRTFYSIVGNMTVVETTIPFAIYESGDNFITVPSGTLTSKTESWLDSTEGHVTKSYNPDQTITNNFIKSTSKLWVTTVSDELGKTTQSVSDGLGRVSSITDATGVRTNYYYKSGTGELVEIDAAANVPSLVNITVSVYNMLGQNIDIYDPDMGHSIYTYDANGNIKTHTDATGDVTTFFYDNLNRLRNSNTVSGSNTYSTIYIYDKKHSSGPDAGYAKGKPTYISTWLNSVLIDEKFFTYDIEQRLISEKHMILDTNGTLARTATQSYTYNEGGQMTSMTYPDGEVVTYEYNSMSGLIANMRKPDWSYIYVNSFIYLMPFGKVKSMQYGNNVTSSYEYYDNNEDGTPDTGLNRNYILKKITFNKSGGINHYQTYTYDKVGNVMTITDKNPAYNQTFDYDDLYRMKYAKGIWTLNPGVDTQYNYDAIGNMTLKEGVTFTYGGTGQPVHAITNDGTLGNTYVYDTNGNMKAKNNTNLLTARAYTYDGNNMLTTVKDGTGLVKMSAGYAGESRVTLTENGTTTYYFFPEYEKKVTGGTTEDVKYYFLNGNRIAERKGTTVTYYHKDVLGSTIKMSDTSGNLRNSTYYKPYGKTAVENGFISPDYKFNDKQISDNLYYYGAKYYNPGDEEYNTSSNITHIIFSNYGWVSIGLVLVIMVILILLSLKFLTIFVKK